jgi:hypothetical protein
MSATTPITIPTVTVEVTSAEPDVSHINKRHLHIWEGAWSSSVEHNHILQMAQFRNANSDCTANITRVQRRCAADENFTLDNHWQALLVLLVLAKQLAFLEKSAFIVDPNEVYGLGEANASAPLEILERTALDQITQILDKWVLVEATLDEHRNGELE